MEYTKEILNITHITYFSFHKSDAKVQYRRVIMPEENFNYELIKQGAEGRIYRSTYSGNPCIVKERFQKKYRHPELDQQLTKERMRAESKAITKCKAAGIKTPELYLVDLQERKIFMEYFKNSITAKEFIFNASDELINKLSEDIGKNIALMHSNKIVHGDLTTSNMLLVNKKHLEDFYNTYDDLELVFIDFGLARLEANSEEKAVDLYVLERALLSTHSIAEQIFPNILKAYQSEYKNTKGCSDVLKKFEDVRARGRKRTMVG